MIIGFRPEAPDDGPFLRRLIQSTIEEELGASAWPEPMRTHLIGLQCSARNQAVRGRFPEGESRIILADSVEAGWLYTAGLPEVVWLVEAMILPEHRGQGIGSAALRDVIGSAGARPVQLKVNVTNTRAIGLYERLGFRRVGGDAVQHLMERTGPQSC
jgi:GNAT superfamily N-acetyltransferase